jgi:hypothetical protein
VRPEVPWTWLEPPLLANTGQHRYGMIAMDLKVIWEMSIHTNHGK